MKKIDLILLGRGYATEFIASGVILAIVTWQIPTNTITDTLHVVSGKLAILTGGLMAASFGLLGVYFGQTSSEFGKYLSWRGVSTSYLAAFGMAGIYHVITTISLIFFSAYKVESLALLCVFMLSMSVFNVFSLVTNLISIVRLRDLFNKEIAANNR